jgi:RNA polymerase sigma-70 factor, ECF subfamily
VARHGSDPLANPEPLLRQVYAYAAYRVGSGPEAEDVLSDVLERALRYRSSYDASRGSPVAWLLGIARRVIAERASMGDTYAELPDQADPTDIESESLDRITLEEAMARLPERDQELLALRYGADLKASQIAAVLDMQVNAVEVALHRSLARLRDVMSESDQPMVVDRVSAAG